MLCLAFIGCRSTTEVVEDPRLCPQTYEFGNFGCTRVVAIVSAPTTPLPLSYRTDVRMVPARANSGWEGTAAGGVAFGPAVLDATLMFRALTGAADTLSVWIVARTFDLRPPIPVGQTPPLAAVDSTLHLLRFAAVGSFRRVDTVRLQLRAP